MHSRHQSRADTARGVCWCRSAHRSPTFTACLRVCRLLQETERKLADLRARRKDHVRAVLMQQNFLLGACTRVFVCVPTQIVGQLACISSGTRQWHRPQRSAAGVPLLWGHQHCVGNSSSSGVPCASVCLLTDGSALLVLGLSTTGDDDPLEGLTPAQIVMFCEKYGIDPTDPLEVRPTPPRALPASGQQLAVTATAGHQAATRIWLGSVCMLRCSAAADALAWSVRGAVPMSLHPARREGVT